MTSRTLVLVARAQRLAVALLAVTFLVSAPTAAGASARPRDAAGDAQSQVDSARRAANAQGGRYMSALSAFERLKSQRAGVEGTITQGEQRADALRHIVQKRAARAYMRAGSSLPSLLTVGDLPDLMRSDKLLATANLSDADALSLLNSQQADLRTQREDLRRLEDQQGSALADLQRASRRADALLASALRNRTDVQARLNEQAAAARATQRTRTVAKIRAVPATVTVPVPTSGGAGGAGSGGSGSGADAFLACVRQRESHGNYSVVNPSGPYYGAYQFLASTWNVAARHAGRIDLVGVIPSQASPADQDAIARSLYQWQGAGPWGGGC
ncbi:MAG: transglycosylase family protein [Acidimicrobiia bacterium]